MRNGDDFSPAVIDRLAALLSEFRHGGDLTLSQLAARVELPRSSVHRLLSQLVDCAWVTRNGRTYSLSREMMTWGARAQQQDRLYRAAHPLLHELHRSTGLHAHLAVLNGPDVRHLDCVGPAHATSSGRVGAHQPALRTAPGRVIVALAGVAHPQATRTLEQLAANPRGAEVRQEIARIRQRHVALAADPLDGTRAWLSVPIGAPQAAIGALSLSGPTDQISEVGLSRPLRTAAAEISRTLLADRHLDTDLVG